MAAFLPLPIHNMWRFFAFKGSRKKGRSSMEATRGRSYEPELDGTRRREMIEMHLFDDDAAEEKALCEADTSDDDRRSAMCYLEDRLHGAWVGTVCEGVQGTGGAVRS